MACKSGYFLHAGIPPTYNLVKTVSVGADELIYIFTEHQIADLGPCINAINLCQGLQIPKSDTSVSGTTTTSKNIVLMRRPGNGLDSGVMLGESGDFTLVLETPDKKFIVIAT